MKLENGHSENVEKIKTSFRIDIFTSNFLLGIFKDSINLRTVFIESKC